MVVEKKVAIWIENNWSLGRIHRCIKRVLKLNGTIVRLFDWRNLEDNREFVKTWKDYDVIISNTAITFELVEKGLFKEYPRGFLERCLVILHCPRISQDQFTERVGPESISKSTFCGVSEECVMTLKSVYNIDAYLTPFGADLKAFSPCVESGQIAQSKENFRVGLVGRSTNPAKIKNPNMFLEICQAANVTPIFIHGKPLEESNTFYSDIDILICCSDFEAGPLGIFEAAACKVPVLLRKGVGNADKIKGIQTFTTIDEAVAIINDWKTLDKNTPKVTKLKEYAEQIHQEVCENWDMDKLIFKHILPIINQMPTWLDFLEIGTSDFDTEIEKCALTSRGVSIEPVQFYLDRLPNKQNVQKICCAISDSDGTANIYSLYDHVRVKYNLPNWVRGCNRMNEPHPTVEKLLVQNNIVSDGNVWRIEEIPKLSFESLVKHIGLERLIYLKLDTEGHDCVIMKSLAHCIRNVICKKPLLICFETNILTNRIDQLEVIQTFTFEFGYKIERVLGDETFLALF